MNLRKLKRKKMRRDKELLEAKRVLYGLLLELTNEEEITDNEADLLYSLVKDEQIRKLIKEHLDKK